MTVKIIQQFHSLEGCPVHLLCSTVFIVHRYLLIKVETNNFSEINWNLKDLEARICS
jgi:hypothetical protein